MAGVVALVGGVVAGRSTVKLSFGERCCAGAELGDGEYGYKACIGIGQFGRERGEPAYG